MKETIAVLLTVAVLTVSGCQLDKPTPPTGGPTITTTSSDLPETKEPLVPEVYPELPSIKLWAPSIVDAGTAGTGSIMINTQPIVGDYFSLQLPAAGGRPPYSWEIVSGSLPPGLELDPSGLVSGIPQKADHYSFTTAIKDSEDTEIIQTVKITPATYIYPRPDGMIMIIAGEAPLVVYKKPDPTITVNARMPPDFSIYRYFSLQPYIQGANPPWSVRIVGLPRSLTYDRATGLITGKIDELYQPARVDVFVRDAGGIDGSGSFTINPNQNYGSAQQGSGTQLTGPGTLSVSSEQNLDIVVQGFGVIGRRVALVSLSPGDYRVSGVDPVNGRTVWQTIVRVSSGLTTIVRK